MGTAVRRWSGGAEDGEQRMEWIRYGEGRKMSRRSAQDDTDADRKLRVAHSVFAVVAFVAAHANCPSLQTLRQSLFEPLLL